jgi:hypothetical protein
MLLVDSIYFHHKNKAALNSYSRLKIDTISIDDIDKVNLGIYDIVYSPLYPIKCNKWPKTKFLFGPHFSVFPEERLMKDISCSNSIYLVPSDWCAECFRSFDCCHNMNIKALPFGVDTITFQPNKLIENRSKIFIYFKSRSEDDLNFITDFLNKEGITNYKIFSYKSRYNETEYLEYLKDSKLGIWVGAHESQGFALQEALSCDVPLLVWNIKTMSAEFGSNFPPYSASTIPYWSSSCGEYFYERSELDKTFNRFMDRLLYYQPRDFIMKNLSREQCESKLLEILSSFPGQ